MIQETTEKETQTDDELLEIYSVQFRYNKEELTLERKGFWIGNNPDCDETRYAPIRENRKSDVYKNKDWDSGEIKELLEKKPSIENSLRIWNTLSNASRDKLMAIYIPNETFKKKYGKYLSSHSVFPSRIILLLKEYNWISDQEGNFHKPSPDFYRESVHSDFKCDNRNGWLDEIGLMPGKKKQEQRKLREEAAKTLGFTMEEVELFTKYKEIKKLESKNL